MENILNNVLGFGTTLLGKAESGADRVMDNFESYSVKYSNLFMYGFILFLIGKFVKINLKLGK